MNITRHEYSKTAWIDEFILPECLAFDFDTLWNLHPEEYGLVKMQGKLIHTPRWQQTYGRSYKYSGMNHPELPIPEKFKIFFDWANESGYGPFNQMLINWYQNGLHYIGKHRDSSEELEPDSPILSISLGETRTFRIRDYSSNEIVDDLQLSNKLVVVMCGTFNNDYTHEIPKINGIKGLSSGKRINITFRKFI